MSRLSWISGILALCGVLAARERATELSIVQLCFLVGMCFLAYILIRRYAIMRSRGQRPSSDSTISSGPCGFIPSAKELNASLYELYKPLDTPPSMSVIFLHGLQSGDDRDPHLSTWKSGDGSCLWPQTWLTETFPGAHVLSVSYSAHVRKNVQGDFDIYNIGENLLSDILQQNVGQAPYCPVILVGHCFGGFVIKQLCNHAYETFNRASDQKKVKLAKFLKNIRGIFYYGTPHHGSPLMNTKVHHLGSDLFKYFKLLSKGGARLNDEFAQSNLLTYFKLLSKEGARLNENFQQLRRLNPKWQIHGLGESLPTKSGLFQGVVGAPEASSRAGDSFNVVEADHIQICRPEKETSRSFYGLVDVLEIIAKDVKEEEARVREEKAQAAEKARLQNLKYLPEQIIGIEVPIQEVKTKLVESRTLGLVGMGGCGKTTLAKAIFNNLESGFEYSSFVPEVKLISGRVDDVKKEVWSQMHHFGKEMVANPEWSLLKEKSLLLVLDDVSSDRDLEVLFDIAKDLSPASRFLVTSRDRDLLKMLDYMYDVPFLSFSIAQELFMRHAFPEQKAPPSQLESLVDAIVEKCDGLPLTLEIIGKYLHKRDEKQDWEQTFIALGRADSVAGLSEKLWEKLKLSFLGLQEEEQQIFLDVATFFCGNRDCTLGEAKVYWKAAYALSNERLLWRTLVDRSLVYDVQESDTIQMHEQLRDLGKKIAAKQNKIRRVWDQKEAMGLFQSTSQRHDEEIFALRLHLSEAPKQTLTTSRRALLCLKHVRYLDVAASATIHGDQEDKVEPFLTNLVFVRLCGVHQHFTQVLFDSSILTRLVILHLSDYNGEDLPKSISDLSALKILKLNSCRNLHSLPESFGNLSALTNLQFRSCDELQTLPESFGHLSALNNLQFSYCAKLQALPESFGHLSVLTNLQFELCAKLQTLPESFRHLSTLNNLQFSSCAKLQTLPESFGHLSALTNLQFKLCPGLQTLPESFGHLSVLTNLQFQQCHELQTLPESFGHLLALSNLQFSDCAKLQTLPESFGHLSALTNLQFTACLDLQTLPESFGHLSVLTNLQFTACLQLQIPESFGHLSALTNLQFSYCAQLQTLPESFGHLSALTNLQFSYCLQLQTLPESFGHLSALTNLQFSDCAQLQTLPESFGHLSALTNLQFSACDVLQTLPESFGDLSALTNLQFSACHVLQTLPESFGHLSALTNLQFSACHVLQTLPESFGDLLALTNLQFSACHVLQTLPELFGHLQFHECETFCPLSSSFGQLTKLEDLKISDCLRLDIFPNSFAELTALRHLSIERVALTSVPDSIRSLPSLQVLELGCLPFVKEFPPWLGEAEAGLRKMSINTFHVQDGNLTLRAQRTLDETAKERLTTRLLILALKRVRSSNLVRRCDECGMYPLEWPRYESSPRFHYSLCPKCFQQSGSNATEYNCVDCPVHPSVTCDGCEMFPLKGPRYKSSTRSNFDLCHDCFQRSGSNGSEYNCFDPPIVSAGDGTTDILNFILALDADDRNSEIHWSSKRVQYRVVIFLERGVLKRLVGDLLGALEDLNKALEIGLSHTSSDFDFRKNLVYFCLKHRAYVKFLLGDLDGARRNAQEALSISSENIAPEWIPELYGLGAYPVKFLGFEMK